MTLPLEYWEADDSLCGGVVSNVSETGLLIHSVKDIPVGSELNIRVFFPDGYRFEGFRVTAKVLWKELHHETDWKVYKYGLEFTKVSEEDRRKLVKLIGDRSASKKKLPARKPLGVRNPPSDTPGSYPSVRFGQASKAGVP